MGGSIRAFPQDYMSKALLDLFQNGSVASFSHGSEVKVLESENSGDAFQQGFDLFDRQITWALLLQVRATMEARFGSRADSETGMDIAAMLGRSLRRWLVHRWRRDVFYTLVEQNFDTETADEFTPVLKQAKIGKGDFAKAAQGVAALAGSAALHTSQYPGIWEMLDLPEADEEAWHADMQAALDAMAMAGRQREALNRPGKTLGGDNGKEPSDEDL